MFYQNRSLKMDLMLLVSCFLGLFLLSCGEAPKPAASTSLQTEPIHEGKRSSPLMTVYKNPNCGCCNKWITHLQESGFQVEKYDRDDLNPFKLEKGISPQYQSCHTGVSPQGHVFEGHVPAIFIQRFLKDLPENSIGLSVPAMPVGTPGMEVGDKFMPYKVLLLMKDGSVEDYAVVNRKEDQF